MTKLNDLIQFTLTGRPNKRSSDDSSSVARNAVSRINEYQHGKYLRKNDIDDGTKVTIFYDPRSRQYMNDYNDSKNGDVIKLITSLTNGVEFGRFRGNGRTRKQGKIVIGTITIKSIS